MCLEYFRRKKVLKTAEENLKAKDFKIFKALLDNPMGLTKEQIYEITGYKMSGWTISAFNKQGYETHLINNEYILIV